VHSYKTKPAKNLLKKNALTLLLIPAGCTGIVQAVDISLKWPFEGMPEEQIDNGYEEAD